MQFLGDLGRNLLAGTRLSFFLPVHRETFRYGVNALVPLVLGGLALLVLVQAFLPQWPLRFYPQGFGYFSFIYLLLLFCALAMTRLQRGAMLDSKLAVLFLSAMPVVWVVANMMPWIFWWASIDYSKETLTVINMGAALWVLLVVYRALGLVFESRWKIRVSSVASFALLFLPAYSVVPAAYFWHHDYRAELSEHDEERDRLNVEKTYAAQHPLLNGVIDSLQEQRQGIADLYFIGFAGYSDQDVFMKEVQSAQTLLDERFDTAGRSLALINNRQTIDEVPIASVTNLRRSLAAVAERMNPEEDILFLFLTSHGSRKHVLSVDFWPLELNRLPAQDLAELLDESGIKNRIIAVSACYSGGFIEPLKNEHSLIMTASRADRNSFGCSNQRDFTYFGQAYFDEQLRNGFDFVEAFEGARERLTKWEADEDLTPSEPQIYLGATIAPLLELLVERLQGATPPQAHSSD